ncbi:uncharacterized protein LOC126366474 [Pectinophora gossypiella]|uniref:uncharacterized protein LOC126366474 n=1 Tax=Pectinophora gossypiella TaxID=13191 RepID=UPI00214E44B9|nr:uncharacterized protein LOC126366474 [Pectinophora gossypiella]
MGKRKRSRSRSRSEIQRKVKKLERKLEKYKKHASRSSSSETVDNPERQWTTDEFENTDNFTNPDDIITLEDEEPLPGPSGLPTPPAATASHTSNNEELINEGQSVDEPSALDPEILQILGDDPNNLKEYGELLHKDLASRWSHIVMNGLDKEIKQELLKKYLTPENCKNLKAPKLNLEVKAALNDFSIKKDSYNQTKQNQLSSALAAIGSALNMILTSKDSSNQTNSDNPNSSGSFKREGDDAGTCRRDASKSHTSEAGAGTSARTTILAAHIQPRYGDAELQLACTNDDAEAIVNDQTVPPVACRPYPGGSEIIRTALVNSDLEPVNH